MSQLTQTGKPTNTNPVPRYSFSRTGYSLVGYNTRPGIVPVTYAKAANYVEPLRCLIEIRDFQDPSILKYTYDSFRAEHYNTAGNAIQVLSSEVTVGQGQTGTFNFTILDNEKVIPRKDVRKSNVIIIKGKKYEGDQWVNLLWGFQKALNPIHDPASVLKYKLSGYGSGIVLNDRIVNFRRMPKSSVSALPGTQFGGFGGGDPTMHAHRLYRELYAAADILLVGDGNTVANQGHFDLDSIPNLISPQVKDQLYGINDALTPAREVHNKICDITGADGGVDAYNRPYLRYHNLIHSGITLKSWDFPSDADNVDLAINTGYFFGPFDYTMDWSKESGFANRLVAKSIARPLVQTSNVSAIGAAPTGNFIDLNGQDRGVRFRVGAAKFNDIALLLQRIGTGGAGSLTFEGTRTTALTQLPSIPLPGNPVPLSPLLGGASNEPVLHGHIVRDWGGFPIGGELATFEIPLSTIPTTAAPMFLTNIAKRGDISPDEYAWILLYATSLLDPTDTIRWYHNGARDGLNCFRALQRDHNAVSGWSVSVDSFEFIYNIYDTFTFPVVAEDVESQQVFGLVEDVVDVSWAPNNSYVSKYINEELNIRSQPKIVYRSGEVSIPHGSKLYEPGQTFSIGDQMTDLPLSASYMGTIEEVTYSFGTEDDQSLGCKFVDLTPLGYYDYRADQENF